MGFHVSLGECKPYALPRPASPPSPASQPEALRLLGTGPADLRLGIRAYPEAQNSPKALYYESLEP